MDRGLKTGGRRRLKMMRDTLPICDKFNGFLGPGKKSEAGLALIHRSDKFLSQNTSDNI
jgi:hypothetical protein